MSDAAEILRLSATVDRLETEIEQLRAALQQIIGRYETTKDDWPAEDVMTAMVVIARAALEHKP